jgi:poly(3-hydroxybutyrate) depolymerase
MRRSPCLAALAAVLSTLLAQPGQPASDLPAGQVAPLSYLSPADGLRRAYDLRVPRTWDGTSLLPAVVLLHGRGGTKRQFQRPEYFAGADEKGAVLVFWEGRRLPDGSGFPSTHYVDGVDGVPDETDVLACLDDAIARAPIDPDRVALAGFSQGGRGALNVGLLNPTRFAALVDAAGPTDAFQGQAWSPTFPDFLSAAGGAPSAGGEVLARWFELSPRFLLPNARNLSVAVLHGQADVVVPDSLALFPYRNGHHVSVTAGFADARGPTPTLSELHAFDPQGYTYATWFPADVGHDQLRLLPPEVLFGAALGTTRAERPERVVGVSFGARERTFYWARLARSSPPDGTRVAFDARIDAAPNVVDLSFDGPARVRFDLPAAGLDAARDLSVRIAGGPRLDLSLAGPFAPALVATLDGEATPIVRTAEGATLSGLVPRRSPSLLVVSPAPIGPVADADLLVPALVDARGANGSVYATVLTVGNASETPLVLSALLLDGESTPFPLEVPARSSLSLGSSALLAASGRTSAAAPLRLRVVSGEAGALLASSRVFNVTAAGTYGLTFPVLQAAASVEGSGSTAFLFGPRDPSTERMNVSLFAPFEASAADVTLLDASGAPRRTHRVDLPPLRRVQLDDLLAGGAPGDAVSVTVSGGRVQLYGTVVSRSATNDPYRVPAVPLARASTSWTVPAVASAEGRNGATFRSDLFLFSTGATTVDATLLPRDGSPAETARLSLSPGSPLVVEDLLATLDPAKAPGAGALRLASTAPLLPLAVTRSAPPTGPSSQDLPCVAGGDEAAPGRPVAFVGVDESPAARSNLVLVAGGAPARVRLVLLAREGPRGERTVDLAAGRVAQLDSVAASFPGGDVEGATLLVQPESGAIVASVSRIDNATNDPAGLAPLPFERP